MPGQLSHWKGKAITGMKILPLFVFWCLMSVGVGFGMGFTPFLLGWTADHFNFRVGIFNLGLLTAICSFSVPFLKEEKAG